LPHDMIAPHRLDLAARRAGARHPSELPRGARTQRGPRAPASAVAHSALVAPVRLVSETRESFRRDALLFVDRSAREGWGSVDVDLRQTVEVDASGLGILVLLQRRAVASALRIRLLHVRVDVYRLLALTKLDHLFEFVD
jgi:ABC-type transporter Mla MlaB component